MVRSFLLSVLKWAALAAIVVLSSAEAYRIRLYAIKVYGRIIHEFDPWFNFRATQYLADNGWSAFFSWYDHRSWYPIGRPVGTTIYPGMQITAVWLWRALGFASKQLNIPALAMSLNDVCVFIPAWFGALASVLLGLMTLESSASPFAAACSTAVMAIIPAHLMRSIGGGFDNECIAMSAMVGTFWLWLRSLRTKCSWPIGALAGLAYAYMAAAWGGYVFVGNLVALHAAVTVVLGRYSASLHKSYSLFWIIGTAIASRVPVIGMAPYRSIEQLAPLLTFGALQVLALVALYARKAGLSWKENRKEMMQLHTRVAAVCGGTLAVTMGLGVFWPASARVASLFIKHTRTGNPLVDSVAEHQPASAEAYWHYLNIALPLMIPGLVIAMFRAAAEPQKKAYGVQVNKYFLLIYALVAYYFANRMNRLILLMGPIAAALSGIAIAWCFEWGWSQIYELAQRFWAMLLGKTWPEDKPAPAPVEAAQEKPKKKGAVKAKAKSTDHPLELYGLGPLVPQAKVAAAAYHSTPAFVIRVLAAFLLVNIALRQAPRFWAFCDEHARQSSQPSVMFQATLNNGKTVIIRDYMDCYEWISKNTPEDSRVLAWWDYGYHITGIANRTSLADGNTWNLEHIATIGRIMTAPEKKGYELARKVADYVLVWSGNHGDDLSKSPHLARIGSSVYDDVCPPRDQLCYSFGFDREGRPTPSMEASMLYKLHSNGVRPGVTVNPQYFQEVFTSKYGLIRVYKILNVDEESKAWVANPKNRICDAPGSWYCVGQYPPGFQRPPKTHRNIKYD